MVNVQHDMGRLCFGFAKELHQHVHDETHGGVVVVVEDHLIASGSLGLVLFDKLQIAFVRWVLFRVRQFFGPLFLRSSVGYAHKCGHVRDVCRGYHRAESLGDPFPAPAEGLS